MNLHAKMTMGPDLLRYPLILTKQMRKSLSKIKRNQKWIYTLSDKAIENRIYIRGEFNRKKCKTAILLYCFHIAGVLHIFVLYNLLGPGTSFYRKLILKENQIMK